MSESPQSSASRIIAAPDLTLHPPRSARVRLGGYVILPRMLDKGRATLAGQNGQFNYNSYLDQHWLNFTGIDAEAMKAELAKGKGDGDILAWIQATAPHKKQAWEIQQWTTYHNLRGPDSDAETLEFFTNSVRRYGPLREDILSWFDLLDLDDFVTFGGSA